MKSLCYFIFKILSSIILLAQYSRAFRCTDRYCSITMNANNQTILDCQLGQLSNNTVQCLYDRTNHQLILTTESSLYVTVDQIAAGAFARLLSGIAVEKIYLNKFQFDKLNKSDFQGLSNISEMRIENPKLLSSDTFTELTTQRQYFVLIISCIDGQKNVAFSELELRTKLWRVITENCNEKLICQWSTCRTSDDKAFSRIIPEMNSTSFNFQLSSRACKFNSSCKADKEYDQYKSGVKRRNPNSRVVHVRHKIVNNNKPKRSKIYDYYDSMMSVLLVVMGINSFFIALIFIFVLVWLRKLSSSRHQRKKQMVTYKPQEQ